MPYADPPELTMRDAREPPMLPPLVFAPEWTVLALVALLVPFAAYLSMSRAKP